ncbi:MAG: response regulator [Bacteroides sp.]|nr:response regulator [Bacteroides sp.]
MKNFLKDSANAERLLKLTSDTLLLIDKKGNCVDIAVYNTDLWFLDEEKLIGKNILELTPFVTRRQFYPDFMKVVQQKVCVTGSYQLPLGNEVYYFKCIMYPYDDMVLCQYRDITQRSQRKMELEKKNRELNEIQKAASIGSWQYNSGERIFYYTGHTGIMCSDERQGMPLETYRQLILPDDRSIFDTWIEKNLQGNITNSIDYRIAFQGDIHYLRLKAFSRERHRNGETTLEGYIQNITDIQQRRNDINLLTHAINNSTEDIYAAHQDGTLLFCNRCFKERHHINNSTDITRLKIYDLPTYGRNRKQWEELFSLVAREEGKGRSFITNHPLPMNPEVLAMEGNSYIVTDDQGIQTLWTFAKDITPRIKREQELKRFTQILNNTIENLPASIVVKDIENEFRYLYRNRESYKHSDDLQSAIGKNDFDFHPREMALEKLEQDIRIARTGESLHWVEEHTGADGRAVYLDKRKLKIAGEDFPPMLLSIEWDITEMELMKRELMAAKEKAEASDRLKSAFLANMSHEIRTPLNAIVGFSQIIAESTNAEERNEYYQIIETNNERLLQLINEILDLSKIEAGMAEFTSGPIDLHQLCREVHDAHRFRCPEQTTLIFEPSDEHLIAEGDKNRLFQVFSNLIGNAFKFTPQGCVSYGYCRKGEMAEFHVSDTGVGVPREKLPTIFDRFVKANDFVQGTGLGLSISKTIIERMGGSISVTSEEGKGTCFTFTLPLLPDKPDETSSETTATTTGNGTAGEEEERSSATILVAEDTDSNYILISAILGRNYHLERAHDGIEAVRRYEELHPDLILMDMKMPNLNGLDATRIIRELSPTIPIIALTAHAYEHDKQVAQEAGCTDFLTKPFTQEVLKVLISRYLRDRSHSSS